MSRTHPFTATIALGLALGACLHSFPALSDDDDAFNVDEKPKPAPVLNNWIDFGGQFQSGRSAYLDRYRGSVGSGVSALAGFRYGQRSAWDSDDATYFEATGRNLGFDDRSLSAKIGQQGSWGLNFSYDGIPYFGADSFKTAFQPNGLLVPGISPGSLSIAYQQLVPRNGIVNSLWIPQATNPPNGLRSLTLSTQRDVFNTGGKWRLGNWAMSAGWRHEHKEGYQPASVAIGGTPSVTTAGVAAAAPTAFTSGLAYFAQPVDYDTDRFDLTAAYVTRRFQTQLGYTFSNFTDNSAAFTAQNPFNFFSPTLSTVFGGPASNVTAIYAQPPSNSAHQLKGQFAYNVTPSTRLNVNLGYGLQLQNADYQSGIGATSSLAQSLPRSSFDGVMKTYFSNVALTTRPYDRVDMRFAYTLDSRENKSPQNSYLSFPVSAANTSFLYRNLPFSYQHQAGTIEAGYRIAPQTKVTLSDTLDSTHRTYSNTSDVTSNRVAAKLRSAMTDEVFGSVSVAHEDRTANNYNANGWWQSACGGCNVEPANFIIFSQASRVRDEVKTTLDLAVTPTLTTTLIAKLANDQYPDGQYGLRRNYNLTVGPDVSWQVSPSVTAHAFYNYQQIYYNQNSLYQSPGAPAIPAPAAGNNQFLVSYSAKSTDSVHSVGANLDWQVIPDVLKLGFDYSFSYGNTSYALGDGVVAFGGSITSPTFLPSIANQALPDVRSMLNVFSIRGEYTIAENVTLLFGYAFERFSYKDFMLGGGATQFGNALMPGSLVPNDSIHLVSAGMRFRF